MQQKLPFEMSNGLAFEKYKNCIGLMEYNKKVSAQFLLAWLSRAFHCKCKKRKPDKLSKQWKPNKCVLYIN